MADGRYLSSVSLHVDLSYESKCHLVTEPDVAFVGHGSNQFWTVRTKNRVGEIGLGPSGIRATELRVNTAGGDPRACAGDARSRGCRVAGDAA